LRVSSLILTSFVIGLWALTSAATPNPEPVRAWNFDGDSAGQPPAKFTMGTFVDGRPAGDWKVIESPQAVSPPKVLAQLRNKGAEHNYNLVLIEETNSSNLDLSVSFLPISGKADMGGGLVWRAADDRNYYLTRANPLEQNIRIYRVVKGIRHMLENVNQTIDIKRWHTLRVTTRGCQIKVFYDEKPVFDLCDETFTTGRVGLWTKSDAVTYFDDLTFQILK
jgi:hypothetical protein